MDNDITIIEEEALEGLLHLADINLAGVIFQFTTVFTLSDQQLDVCMMKNLQIIKTRIDSKFTSIFVDLYIFLFHHNMIFL